MRRRTADFLQGKQLLQPTVECITDRSQCLTGRALRMRRRRGRRQAAGLSEFKASSGLSVSIYSFAMKLLLEKILAILLTAEGAEP